MNIKYLLSGWRTIRMPGLWPLMRDWFAFLRLHFLDAALETGFPRALQTGATREALIDKLDVKRPELLTAHQVNEKMRLKPVSLLTMILTLIYSSSWCQEQTYKQGINIFIETGVTQPDRIPTWYAPMVAMPHAPVFEILATKGTQGRYYQRTYAVTIKDIIKWHGHDCEGITHVANCCKTAFNILFPDGIVDRSVLRGISGTGPCWSDGLAFLTGARLQYGSLGFFKNKDYNRAVILYREDTGVAVLATWKKGINNIPDEPVVLPGEITWKTEVDMQKVMDLKRVVKNAKEKPNPYQVDLMRYYQWRHVNDVLSHPLSESYQAEII